MHGGICGYTLQDGVNPTHIQPDIFLPPATCAELVALKDHRLFSAYWQGMALSTITHGPCTSASNQQTSLTSNARLCSTSGP